jgi:predicted RNase H-like nuclease (RuvC/YqgF family)
MEPDQHEELPAPTGVTINLDLDRVLQHLQRRSAQQIQNLQWDLAQRDAVVEVLEERLRETDQLREEAEGALNASSTNELDYARELSEARAQIAKLVKGEAFLLERIEELTTDSDSPPAQRDAFLEAGTLTIQPGPVGEPAPEDK